MGTDTPIDHRPIIFFDGVCNLCNGAVRFIIRRDPDSYFRFATLQSAYARKFLSEMGYHEFSEMDSIILIKEGNIFVKSDAALGIARHLSGIWPALYGLRIFPRYLRNFVYDLVANNRYKWFGKKDACMIPTPEIRSRFIED